MNTAMVLNNGNTWAPEIQDIDQWKQLYPAVNVEQELRAMAGWLNANPSRRKTSKGIKRFVNSWLSRAQDKGGSPMARHSATGIKSMTSMDELTHNFTKDPVMREYFIRKYGQCYEDGVRYA